MKNDSKLSKNSLYFYSLFFFTFVINKYRRFFGRSEKFFYPNYTSIEYLGMGSNLTRFKNKIEKGKREKKKGKKKWKKNRRNVPKWIIYQACTGWDIEISAARDDELAFYGWVARVSLTIIVLCPFVYTHREFRRALRCNVSHVSINETPFRTRSPSPPFFRKGRKKKRQLRVEMLERKLQPIRQLRDRKERSLKNFSCPLIITRFFSSNVAYFSRSR